MMKAEHSYWFLVSMEAEEWISSNEEWKPHAVAPGGPPEGQCKEA